MTTESKAVATTERETEIYIEALPSDARNKRGHDGPSGVTKSAGETAHFGDPCIYCNVAHDEVPPGPCKARVFQQFEAAASASVPAETASASEPEHTHQYATIDYKWKCTICGKAPLGMYPPDTEQPRCDSEAWKRVPVEAGDLYDVLWKVAHGRTGPVGWGPLADVAEHIKKIAIERAARQRSVED